MTLVIAMVHPERIELLSDRATIDENGALIEIRDKTRTRTVPLMAVVGRGRAALLDTMDAALDAAVEAHGIDLGLAAFESVVATHRNTIEVAGADFDMLIAGVSETSGLSLWLFPSHDRIQGFPAYSVTKAPAGFSLAFGGRIDLKALAAKGVQQHSLAASLKAGTLLSDFGATIAETMREASGFDDETDPMRFGQCSIGGGVDLVTVTEAHADNLPLCRWLEDQIGQPVGRES
ncbi:hypothetical protein G6L13_20005 [Agrobacterium tumefaciens]|uniref:hypothetical protein n=1 Tax=Agrobacterium tumefaciens TaxID=358 RepID=UPI00157299F8|nr:hypothetical protein [Agrobacterium tumefaciens]NTA82782.1 hypothetical protein [Agrobacterium tumefaciens]